MQTQKEDTRRGHAALLVSTSLYPSGDETRLSFLPPPLHLTPSPNQTLRGLRHNTVGGGTPQLYSPSLHLSASARRTKGLSLSLSPAWDWLEKGKRAHMDPLSCMTETVAGSDPTPPHMPQHDSCPSAPPLDDQREAPDEGVAPLQPPTSHSRLNDLFQKVGEGKVDAALAKSLLDQAMSGPRRLKGVNAPAGGKKELKRAISVGKWKSLQQVMEAVHAAPGLRARLDNAVSASKLMQGATVPIGANWRVAAHSLGKPAANLASFLNVATMDVRSGGLSVHGDFDAAVKKALRLASEGGNLVAAPSSHPTSRSSAKKRKNGGRMTEEQTKQALEECLRRRDASRRATMRRAEAYANLYSKEHDDVDKKMDRMRSYLPRRTFSSREVEEGTEEKEVEDDSEAGSEQGVDDSECASEDGSVLDCYEASGILVVHEEEGRRSKRKRPMRGMPAALLEEGEELPQRPQRRRNRLIHTSDDGEESGGESGAESTCSGPGCLC